MRVLCHAQNLTGVGHFVRMHLIAVELAAAHEVHLVDGGRPVPRPAVPMEPRRLRLPVVMRDRAGSVVDAAGNPAGPVLERRARVLEEAVRKIRPDVVLVDHYPFSKWELEAEIEATTTTARRVNPHVRVLCSLRDIVPQRHWRSELPDDHAERVLRLLDHRFDGVLVHCDPAFARLAYSFPRADSVPVPVRYTGFVAERAAHPPPGAAAPWAVVAGGGTATTGFLAAAVAAFARFARSRRSGGIGVHAFLGPGDDQDAAAALGRAGGDAGVEVHSFSADYRAWLAGARLSISHAGYNTTAALLQARVPALVVPDRRVSDQVPRAERLAAAGLATVIETEEARMVDALAAAIPELLDRPPRNHAFDLDGAATTRRLVEEWVGQPRG